MKKLFYFIITLMTVGFSFTSCKDDEKDTTDTNTSTITTINGKAENGSSYSSLIDSVVLVTRPEGGSKVAIIKTKYDNGSFSFKLPESIDEKLLVNIGDIFTSNSKTITISDLTTKMTSEPKFYLTKNGESLGRLRYQNATGNTTVYYVYSNKPCTIKGSESSTYTSNGVTYTEIIKYDITFKKGWNTFNLTESLSGTTSTEELTSGNIPSDVKWYVDLFSEG